MSAFGAARSIARTPSAGAISSTSPTNESTGHSMSASVTSRSSTVKPPASIRLWATNWRMKSASAGPGQATQPSPSRKRRWRSRGSSASRSWSWRTKSTRWRSDLTGSSIRNPVRLIHAGTATWPKTLASASAPCVATPSGIPSGIPLRMSTGLPNVIRLPIPSVRR